MFKNPFKASSRSAEEVKSNIPRLSTEQRSDKPPEQLQTSTAPSVDPVNPVALCPLDQASHCIRLIQLEEPSLNGTISCRLRCYQLDTLPYKACSYVWGPEGDEQIILVNLIPFQVRRSLHQLLSKLSAEERQTALWIDAICIDQASPSERSEQVQIMDEIMSRAMHVIAWLGPSNSELEWLFRLTRDDVSTCILQASLHKREAEEELTRIHGALVCLAKKEYWDRI